MTAISVVLERAGSLESLHRVHAVVVHLPSGDSEVFGNSEVEPFWRSSMKPFQALPVVLDRALEGLGRPEETLALACASHHATDRHIQIVASLLDALDVSPEQLACGPHRPMDGDAARVLDAAGQLPERIHNNCSGKHAAMLALARANDWPLEGYQLLEHPVQKRIRGELAVWLDADPESLTWGVDGCGVPTPRLSLGEMARAYARLAVSEEPAPVAVVSAMTGNPMLVSGPTAFSANIMKATDGRVLAKEGAEGVFCLACPTAGWGAAFKVADGAMRAIGPAVIHVLEILDCLAPGEIERLGDFAVGIISNTREEAVAILRVPDDPD